ncbi:hypothetical protein AAEX37_01598 [Oligella sp. MSHR50489EDL]
MQDFTTEVDKYHQPTEKQKNYLLVEAVRYFV